MNRVGVYVDGFNLYFGLKAENWRRYYWLDIQRLATNLLKPDQTLALAKYFTAVVSRPADKHKRQNTFLEANQVQGLDIFHGKFKDSTTPCCGRPTSQEKMTDVNIAVELVVDAFQDRFDTALLISGDSDLAPPLRSIRQLFPGKRVVVGFPPQRIALELKAVSHSSFVIGRDKFRDSLLPEEVIKPDGFILKRPQEWT